VFRRAELCEIPDFVYFANPKSGAFGLR
jgi:hypothetical protein